MFKQLHKAGLFGLLLVGILIGSNILSACAIEVPAYDKNTADPPTAVAPDAPLWEVISSNTKDEVLTNKDTGIKIIQAFRFDENGNMVTLDLEEYARILNSLPIQHPMSDETSDMSFANSTRSLVPYYEFEPTSTMTTLGDSLKMSADIRGPASISYIQSTTITDSFGGSVTVGGEIKEVIKLGASFAWNTSLSTMSQLQYTLEIPSGELGYVRFRPYLNVVRGDLFYVVTYPYKVERTYQGVVWGKSPVMLSGNPGFADGIFEVVCY